MKANMKRIILDVQDEIHRKFKTVVTEQGLTMKGVLLSLIKKYIEDYEKKKEK